MLFTASYLILGHQKFYFYQRSLKIKTTVDNMSVAVKLNETASKMKRFPSQNANYLKTTKSKNKYNNRMFFVSTMTLYKSFLSTIILNIHLFTLETDVKITLVNENHKVLNLIQQ